MRFRGYVTLALRSGEVASLWCCSSLHRTEHTASSCAARLLRRQLALRKGNAPRSASYDVDSVTTGATR